MDEEDLRALDLSGAGDYLLWAAAQAYEELDRPDQAVTLLKRIAASVSSHPALSYPDILLHLQDLLKDSGDYEQALAILDRVERSSAGLAETCRERRAEVLVLSGRIEAGLRLFETATREDPDDPWVAVVAASALLQRGDYPRALSWIGRAERALRRVEDEEEARGAASEIDRLRLDAQARAERRRRFGTEGDPGGSADSASDGGPGRLREEREGILARLDDEEVSLVAGPPRDDGARDRARERLAVLHARASRGWDDAVESKDEEMIAAFDDLQWEIVALAERFGIDLPGTEVD